MSEFQAVRKAIIGCLTLAGFASVAKLDEQIVSIPFQYTEAPVLRGNGPSP